MAVNIDDKIRKLSTVQRKKVEMRAAQLIAEEMTLRELRKARQLTQVRLARRLGITQDGVSRLEKRSDLLLSTLRETVEAMGGNLSLVAQFPDRRSGCSGGHHRGRVAYVEARRQLHRVFILSFRKGLMGRKRPPVLKPRFGHGTGRGYHTRYAAVSGGRSCLK